MDTKTLEMEAVNQIQSLVSRYGFHYSNPNYDKNGADFMIVREGENGLCYTLRCQSKGRNVSIHASSVVIPQSYMVDYFLVFVYVRPENVDETETYLYTATDIRKVWKVKDGNYVLNLSKNFTKEEDNYKYIMNKERATIVRELLDNVGRLHNTEYIYALSNSDFYFETWKEIGGLPSIEYIRSVFSGDDLLDVGTKIFIFLLCASVIKNDSSDTSLSIDWAFLWLKEISGDSEELEIVNEGQTFRSDVGIAYHNTWVKEILSCEGSVDGFLLHIGDSEESVEAYVMKNGDYAVTYHEYHE